MSSGNVTADRRFAYAQDLRKAGDPAAAADLIAQALELTPDWAEGHFSMGEAWAEAGQREKAVDAFRRCLALDPTDSMGAAAKLSILGARERTDTLPPAYVKRLFDGYADRFDNALIKTLGYVAPQKLRAVIDHVAPGRRFDAGLDLGCGTGLAGVAFRDIVGRLEGVDLSPRMVAEANGKSVYDAVSIGDLVTHMAARPRHYDLILAADVFVYLGDLTPVFRAAATAIRPGGLCAFTLQRRDESGFALGEERRFSHSREHVVASAVAGGWDVLRLDDVVVRQDRGFDVPGLLAVLWPAL
jgi:predicted TPR repeat methyltransferase